jgi:SpoVK/Ycf46/Vps4 family AAA+-type ATPase
MTEVITENTKFANSTQALEVALKSVCPIVWVRTHEEARLISELNRLSKDTLKMDVHVWSLWQGLVPAAQYNSGERATGAMDKTWQPPMAFDKIKEMVHTKPQRGNLVIMRDVHVALQEPVPRQIRDIYEVLVKNNTKIVFVSPHLAHGAGGNQEGLPPTMEKQINVIDFDLPNLSQIDDAMRHLVRNVVNRNAQKAGQAAPTPRAQKTVDTLTALTNEHYRDCARALQGLTILEVQAITSASIQHCQTLSVQFLLESKKAVLARSDILEYFEPNRTMNDIGGMDLIKDWFRDYSDSHTEEAQAFGVEPPKGILMVGIPGCGKSQLCKAVASEWKLPLIRLDVGKVMTGLVGGSESKMRSAIKQVEAIAPCILWIDEVEKALSGTKSSNFSDGGTMARVFGTLLTAMEEGFKGVTILATANDISALPPEFIRRFSETFFVDLPGPSEREDIFKIHLAKKGADLKSFEFADLVSKSENYTGHEIEKAVKRAMSLAFKDPSRKLKTEHVITALDETKPLYHIMGDKISTMRAEARGKYRFASSWAEGQAKKMKAKQEKMDVKDVKLPDLETKNKKKTSSTDDEDVSLDIG